MEDLPDPKLVVFKHSLYKHKTEQEIGVFIIQQIETLGELKNLNLIMSSFCIYVIL